MSAFPGVLSDPLLAFSAEVAAKSTLVLAVGTIAALLLRKAHPAARHRAWALGLLLAAAIPLLVFALPALNLPSSAARSIVSVAPVGSDVALREQPAPRAAAAALPAAPLPSFAAGAGAGRDASGRVAWVAIAVLLAGVWALGSIALLGRIAMSLLRARGVARRARPIDVAELGAALAQLKIARSIRLLESDQVHVPMTGGLLRPVLIVPVGFAQWTPECRRLVLLHELAHVRRRDFLFNLCSEIALALHWFQPLAWLAARRVREEAEVAADDVVIATGAVPSTYASHLLAIVRGVPGGSSAALMTVAMGANPIERRLRTILAPGRRMGGWHGRPAIPILALALTAVLAATRLGATPAQQASNAKSAKATAAEASAQATSADQVAVLVSRAVRVAAARAQRYVVKAHNDVWHQIHGSAHDSTHHDAAIQSRGDVDGTSHDAAVRSKRRSAAQDTEASQVGSGSARGARAFERAHELHQAHEYGRASEAWEEAIHLGYRKQTALYNLACAQARIGQKDRALDSLQLSIEAGFDPGDYLESDRDLESLRSHPRFRALVEEYGGGDRERALATFERLERSGSRDFSSWYGIGKALHDLGEYDDAARAWRRSAEIDPQSANARYNVACAQALEGDADAALKELERAIALGFGGADSIEQDEDFAALRDDERFGRLVARARELELPDGAGSGFSLWRTSPKAWREAQARYERLIEQHPDSGRAWSNLGFARLRLGEGQGAAEAFRTSFDKGYLPGPSAYNVACSYAVLRDADRAFEWLDRAEAAGFRDEWMLATDPDLDTLRDDPRFPKLERDLQVKWRQEKVERKSRERKVQEF